MMVSTTATARLLYSLRLGFLRHRRRDRQREAVYLLDDHFVADLERPSSAACARHSAPFTNTCPIGSSGERTTPRAPTSSSEPVWTSACLASPPC